MEMFVIIALFIAVSALFLDKLSIFIRHLTKFVKQLHTNKPIGLLEDGKTTTFSLTLSSDNKKRNSRDQHKFPKR